MSKAKELIEDISEAKRKRILTQYTSGGNSHTTVTDTQSALDAGVYTFNRTMRGVSIDVVETKSDKLLRFPDPIHEDIIQEIKDFWEKREKAAEMGFTHKRGILMYGPPGSGKTCITKLVVEDAIKKDHVVFLAKDMGILSQGLKEFREVEPDRNALVLMEDVDDLVRYGSNTFLELLSGDSQVDNIMYLATTNYIERLPERALRPDRFDRKIEVPHPPAAGRKAFLKQKLGLVEAGKDIDVDSLVEKTKGFSFAHLKELLISHIVHGYDLDKTIERLGGTGIETAKKFRKMSESVYDSYLTGQSESKAMELLGELND